MTASQGRRFGLTVGGAFLTFAALAWWRGHPATASVLATLGASLALAGLLIPTALGPVERAWMALAHAISRVTTPIVMGLMYMLVVTPFGYLRRTLSNNPLVHESVDSSYWRRRSDSQRSSMERQF